MDYLYWEVTDGCIKAVGGTKDRLYPHYCPKDDFILIARQAISLYEKNKILSRPLVAERLDGRKLKSGKTFHKINHSYKINLTFYVMENSGIIGSTGGHSGPKGRTVDFRLLVNAESAKHWVSDVIKS